MKPISKTCLEGLINAAVKACQSTRWQGEFPVSWHPWETYSQKTSVNIKGYIVDVTVTLFRRSSPGNGCYWAEQKSLTVKGPTHWLHYRLFGGVESVGTMVGNQMDQGVSADEIGDWLLSPLELATQRP